VVRPRKGYNLDPSDEIIVHASSPNFKSIEVSGASTVLGESVIKGDELELGASGASEIRMQVETSTLKADLSGASTLELKGTSSRFSTEASGASKIKCMNLDTDETDLHVSGATDRRSNSLTSNLILMPPAPAILTTGATPASIKKVPAPPAYGK
jgi:hypothetical protein